MNFMDGRRCQASGGSALMLGRGMAVDLGLALAIRQVDADGGVPAYADAALGYLGGPQVYRACGTFAPKKKL
jgi:hypothetical protein